MRPTRRAGARRLEPGEAWEHQLGELLTLTGWTWAHVDKAYVPGRRHPITPMSGPGAKGFPDLAAWRAPEGIRGGRPGRYLVAEAKAAGGHLEPAQRLRLWELDQAGVEAYLFHDSQLERIRALLQRRQRPWPVELDDPDDLGPLVPWRRRPPKGAQRAATPVAASDRG